MLYISICVSVLLAIFWSIHPYIFFLSHVSFFCHLFFFFWHISIFFCSEHFSCTDDSLFIPKHYRELFLYGVLFPTMRIQPALVLPTCVVLHFLVLKYFSFGWLELSKCPSSLHVTAISLHTSFTTWASSTCWLCCVLVIDLGARQKHCLGPTWIESEIWLLISWQFLIVNQWGLNTLAVSCIM